MQPRLLKHTFSKTASGNMNAKASQNSKKGLQMDDFDVQMLSPDFLSGKTLKKPFKQMDIHFKKTNPKGTQLDLGREEGYKPLTHLSATSQTNIIKQKQADQTNQFQFISGALLDIKPAYRPQSNGKQIQNSVAQIQLKDKHSIITALLRKGELNENPPFQIKVIKAEQVKKVGPAQAKLKTLFNKKQNISINDLSKNTKKDTKKHIQEDIQSVSEQIEQDYANQSFQKASVAYQSQIKQSIREQFGASSAGKIKQSIRQSIRQSLGGSSGGIKQSIRDQIGQSIKSLSKSKQEIRQDILQSIKKQSIEQEVYEDIFQQASLSDEISKSRTKQLRRSKQEERYDLSNSGSKKFRTKTNLITKSIKLAEELIQKKQPNKFQDKIEKGDRVAAQIMKQKQHFNQLRHKISAIMSSEKSKNVGSGKNKDLYYKFRIQINRLITSENFMSKLRRITSFLNSSTNKISEDVSNLEDKLLSNLMQKISQLRISGVTQSQLMSLKKGYDEKLQRLLKQQQMSLRVQMDQKLHEKDIELKKMIAQLQQKMKVTVPAYLPRQQYKKPIYGDRVEVDSDYSIDSDEISWKMDLWELLPDFEKKKLYEKQGSEIAQFLTDVLMRDIKNQDLNRSADISFEFPEDEYLNISASSDQGRGKQKRSWQNFEKKGRVDMKQAGKSNTERVEIFPPIPGVKKTTSANDHFDLDIHYLEPPSGKISENEVRQTLSTTQVIKILSKYKNLFLKRKNDLIRKLVKTLQTKTKQSQPLSSFINDIRILNSKDIEQADQAYVKAYEEQVILELINIYNRTSNRKNTVIEEEMKKMYDRLIVTCQIKAAQSSIGSPKEIIHSETYMELRLDQQGKQIKDAVVNQIYNILLTQFVKEMPKRKK